MPSGFEPMKFYCTWCKVHFHSKQILCTLIPFQESKIFWSPTADVKASRLKRFTVPIDIQGDMESERYCFIKCKTQNPYVGLHKDTSVRTNSKV